MRMTMAAVVALFSLTARAADVDELKVKREEVFEFAARPAVTRAGDKITIAFAAKGRCDATVVIEAEGGRIVRHLASGVLGPKAPAPFQADSLRQTVVWDGKDDRGEYIDDKARLTVRVSLGLKPELERVLFWSAKKKVVSRALLSPAPEGVYVFDGSGVDHLRLFDHAGEYLRTVYPFPADKLKEVEGLTWKTFPEGERFPLKLPFYQQTFLTSGESGSQRWVGCMSGYAASALAVQGKRIALACIRLNRLATDGSTGALALEGASTSFPLARANDDRDAYDAPRDGGGVSSARVVPRSAAFSPDGKWVYLTGYTWKSMTYASNREWLHGVWRIPFEGQGEPELFAGSGKRGRELGPEDAKSLKVPAAVACDRQGRVYVADHENDRVQIYSPEGKVLKSVPVTKPAHIALHHRTQEIYVFSWQLLNRFAAHDKDNVILGVKPTYTRFGSFEDPRVIQSGELPLVGAFNRFDMWGGGLQYSVALDSWTDPPTIWLIPFAHDRGVSLLEWTSAYPAQNYLASGWEASGIRLLSIDKTGGLKLQRDFGKDVVQSVVRASWPGYRQVQRLYVNPATGLLYVGEGAVGTLGKSFQNLVEINPATGKIRIIDLPFGAEDLAFDINGLIYLRQTDVIARYNFPELREVPWDYGEALSEVGIFGGRFAKVVSALVMPSRSPVCYHQGGMSVGPSGNLVVSCAYRVTDRKRDIERWSSERQVFVSRPYVPRRHPGREESPTSACAHVWDRHGKLLHEDAIPGMPQVDGIAIDRDNDIYVMATPARILDGAPHFNLFSSTLMKFSPKRGKFITNDPSAPVLLGSDEQPKRGPDLYRGGNRYWVEGAQWFFGGVGYAGFNPNWAPSCACWHARFALDYLGRSFAPEPLRFSVAVVDKNGNLIVRIGRYGNEDSAGAASRQPLGGDEVGLMHPAFLAVHTDRRLFIQDYGNARILSVKLGYHAEEKTALKDVADGAGR